MRFHIVGRAQQHAIIGFVGVLFLVLSLCPLLWPLIGLTEGTWEKNLRALEIFGSQRLWILLARSLGLSAAVVAGALSLGVPMGLLLGRTDVAGRRVLLFLHGFPMFLPPFLLALGWFHLFGQQGILGGADAGGFLFHPFGHIAVLSLAFAPIVTVFVALGLWNLDPSLEEAARVVARPFRVATGIMLPAVWPSIALASIVVSALAFSELGVPMFLRVDVYPAAVFSRLGGIDYDPGEAFLLALPLLPLAVVMVALERHLLHRRPFGVLGVLHRNREPLPLGVWRGALSVVCWTLSLLALLPLAALALNATAAGGFAQISHWIGASHVNSLIGSGLAATAIVFIGAILGHGYARGLAGARSLDLVGVLAFVTPAVLVGVGLIAFWNRPETQWVYRSMAIIVFGFVARYSVIGIRTVAVSVSQSPVSLEEAASAFGAGYLRRFLCIVLPLHGRALASAWLLAMVFCLRDLETAILYYPPGSEPLTVRIFTLEANGPEAVVAGLATFHVALTAFVLSIGMLLLRRKETA